MTDYELMGAALEEAARAAALGEVPVGAVVARNGEIIAAAHNTRETEKNALHHAELLAIDAACKKLGGWRLWQCELDVYKRQLLDGRTGYVRDVALEPVRFEMTAGFSQREGLALDDALAEARNITAGELVPQARQAWYDGSEEAFRDAVCAQAKKYLGCLLYTSRCV